MGYMKRIGYLFLTVLITVFIGVSCQDSKSSKISVVFHYSGDKNIFFQPESALNSNKIQPDSLGHRVYTAELSQPTYFRYIDANQKYYSMYLVPGDEIEIYDDGNEVSFKGDRVAENNFLKEYVFRGYVPEDITPYSSEWVKTVSGEVEQLVKRLQNSGLPKEFIHVQTLKYQYGFYIQLLTGPSNAMAFRNVTVELPDNYYDFLKEMKFDDPVITQIPQWFTVLIEAFERMEKEGMLEVSPDRYMAFYAERIEDAHVRSLFLMRLLHLTLQKGHSDDFPSHVEGVRRWITDTAAAAQLSKLEERYLVSREANRPILRGMKAPEFKAVDLKGKEYTSADFAGRVQVLDFWFTGCVPCRAEMPFMEKIAEEMQDSPISFLSMSLDVGDELIALWKQMVQDKNGKEYQLNVPGGFKSELVKEYLIHGVPRIVIIDKQGNIVDAYAKRPSDPKLKALLEQLVKES